MNQKPRIREPKTLSWANITVNIELTERKFQSLFGIGLPEKETTKIILNKVTGIAKAQSLLAIIGSSGSGKTTLLNCLTNRNLGSLKAEGCILVNGENIGEDLCTISGYVQQDDIFNGALTVREHLWFNAALALSKTLTHYEKQERVEDIMKEMSLKKCEHTIIGLPGIRKGISGGEKKRLAFAEKLLTKPPIMLCDEPTSGLDSSAACSVIEALRNMTNNGHTILTTIHQPSSEVFAMLDEILIMANGRVAFMGSRNDATKFFCGLNYQCPQNYNTSDFLMNTLAIIPGEEEESKEKILKICNSFEESIYFETIKSQIQKEVKSTIVIPVLEMQQLSKLTVHSKYQVSWWIQFQMCLWRSQIELMHGQLFHVKFMYLVIMAIIIGLVYLHQSYTQAGLGNINAAMFIMVSQLIFQLSATSTIASLKAFPSLVKEHYDRLYTVSAYCLAKILIEFPFAVVVTFSYLACAYWMIGLYPEPGTFLTMLAALILLGCYAIGHGHLCGSVVLDPTIAMILQSFTIVLQTLFGGYLIKHGTFPNIFKILEDTSYVRYTYQIILVTQWRDVEHLECEYSNRNQSLNETLDLFETGQVFCYENGIQVIKSFGFEPDSVPYCFGIMILLLIGTMIANYIALIIKVKRAK